VSKLTYWGLIEKFSGMRSDGSRRVGLYRAARKRHEFVAGRIAVPKYAKVYNGQLIGFGGPEITVQDVFGKKFSYNELMSDANLTPNDAENAVFQADHVIV